MTKTRSKVRSKVKSEKSRSRSRSKESLDTIVDEIQQIQSNNKTSSNIDDIASTSSFSLFFSLMVFLSYNQIPIVYPGTRRMTRILPEPFIEVDQSFYRRGTTGKIWVIFGGNNNIPMDWMGLVGQIKSYHSIFIITYPGYNGDTTMVTQRNIRHRVDKCIELIKKMGYKNENINFLAYSLGCAISIDFLSRSKLGIKNFVVLAPFWSLVDIIHNKYPYPKYIIKDLLLHDWKNENIKNVNSKVNIFIFHGVADKMIPCKHGINLAKLRRSELFITKDDHFTVKDHASVVINKLTP